MKKFLLGLLVIVLGLGLLGAAAYAGYRFGFTQGMMTASNGELPSLGHGFGFNRMPMREFGFSRGFDRGEFGMIRRGFDFGFFPLFGFLARLLFLGLVIAGIYWLITRSGWQLTRTAPATATTTTTTVVETPPPASTEENKEV